MLAAIAVAVVVGFLGWAYKATHPPAPKLCGTPGGPPITSPRVKLNDGRHLSYREEGGPKEEAKHRVIIILGYDSSKDLHLPASQMLIVTCMAQVQKLFLCTKFIPGIHREVKNLLPSFRQRRIWGK